MKSIWSSDFPFNPRKFPFFYGWWIALVGTIGAVATMPGQTGGVSVFTDIIIKELELTRLQVSSAYMVGTAASGFLLPWGGIFFDQFGARRSATFSTLGLGIAALFFSQVDRVAYALRLLTKSEEGWLIEFFVICSCFFFLRYFGQGMLSLSSRNMIALWFDRFRGMVLSISGVIGVIAFALGPKILNYGIQNIGWRGTWIIVGITLFLYSVFIIWIFYRNSPEECGLVMDGSLDAQAKDRPKNPDSIFVKEFRKDEALSTYSFWVFTLSLSWASLYGTGYVFHIVSVGDELGLPQGEILDFLIQSSFIAVITMLVTGWISNYIRLKYILLFVSMAAVCWPLGVLLMPTILGHLLIVTGLGMLFGGSAILSTLVWPRFFGRLHLGAISGVATKWAVIGSSLGPLCFAISRSVGGSYRLICVVSIGVGLILAVGTLFADNPQRRLSISR